MSILEEKIEVDDMFREEDINYQVGNYVYHEIFDDDKIMELI